MRIQAKQAVAIQEVNRLDLVARSYGDLKKLASG